MPPKAKGKGKDKKKADDGVAGETPEEKLKKANVRIEVLERELVQRTEHMNRAIAAQNELRAKVADYNEDFEKEKADSFSITADMTRQYKAMQEDHKKRVNALEREIEEKDNLLIQARQTLEATTRDKDMIIATKDTNIAELKQKMEEMAMEFAEMLKETLDKMSEKIDTTNTEWEKSADNSKKMLSNLEDMGLGEEIG